MPYSFRCPETGGPEIVDSPGVHPCPWCGGKHTATLCGAPDKEPGAPAILGDHINKYFDWGAGCWISSRSQKKKVYAEKGLVEKSVKEHVQQHGTSATAADRGTAITYGGQKSHTSTAERGIKRKFN